MVHSAYKIHATASPDALRRTIKGKVVNVPMVVASTATARLHDIDFRPHFLSGRYDSDATSTGVRSKVARQL